MRNNENVTIQEYGSEIRSIEATAWVASNEIYKNGFTPKVFQTRNSVLTDLFHVNHIRCIYHISIALLVIFLIRTILEDFLQEGSVNLHIDLLVWNLSQFHVVIRCWFLMLASIILIFYPSFCLWFKRHPSGDIGPEKWAYLTAYLIFAISLMFAPAIHILDYDLPVVPTLVLLCEQIRLLMKLHSFVRENAYKIMQYAVETKDKNCAERKELACPSFRHFLYFLFAPTLVYRDQYPMTDKIRWREVVNGLFQVAACLFCINYIFVRFCMPEFKNFNQDRVTFRTFILTWFNCILPGSLCFMLCFFLTLHAWQNVFAELMRFGDRLFYKDWWNAVTLGQYYRTWNIIVHDWLYAYVYKDMNMLLSTRNRSLATLVVFCVSAVFHEYIFILSFRFIYPVLFFEFFVFSVPILLITRSATSWISNIFLWLLILTGTGLSLCLYSLEWYARKNCPPTFNHFADYFVPRSWICANVR